MTTSRLSETAWPVYALLATLCFVIMFTCVRIGSGSITPFLFAFIANLVNCMGHLFLVTHAHIRGRLASITMPATSVLIAVIVGICVASNDYSAVYMFKTGAPLSVAVPVFTAGNVLLTVLFGLLVLKEGLHLKRVAGIACIVAGIVLTNV